MARRYNQGSVVGSYLDPLADKVLICCTAGALAYEVGCSGSEVRTVCPENQMLTGNVYAGLFIPTLSSFDHWTGYLSCYGHIHVPDEEPSLAVARLV